MALTALVALTFFSSFGSFSTLTGTESTSLVLTEIILYNEVLLNSSSVSSSSSSSSIISSSPLFCKLIKFNVWVNSSTSTSLSDSSSSSSTNSSNLSNSSFDLIILSFLASLTTSAISFCSSFLNNLEVSTFLANSLLFSFEGLPNSLLNKFTLSRFKHQVK